MHNISNDQLIMDSSIGLHTGIRINHFNPTAINILYMCDTPSVQFQLYLVVFPGQWNYIASQVDITHTFTPSFVLR